MDDLTSIIVKPKVLPPLFGLITYGISRLIFFELCFNVKKLKADMQGKTKDILSKTFK